MIGQDWKISSPFFLAENLVLLVWKIPLENLENSAHGKSGGKSGKLDLLAYWRKIWQAEKSAENLAENLENLTRKICGKFPQSGKSGKSGSCTAAENLRKNPLTGKSVENLENLENPAENLD